MKKIILPLLASVFFASNSSAGCLDKITSSQNIDSKIRGLYVNSMANKVDRHFVILDKATCVAGRGSVAIGNNTKKNYYLYFNDSDKFLRDVIMEVYKKGNRATFRIMPADNKGFNKIGYIVTPDDARKGSDARGGSDVRTMNRKTSQPKGRPTKKYRARDGETSIRNVNDRGSNSTTLNASKSLSGKWYLDDPTDGRGSGGASWLFNGDGSYVGPNSGTWKLDKNELVLTGGGIAGRWTAESSTVYRREQKNIFGPPGSKVIVRLKKEQGSNSKGSYGDSAMPQKPSKPKAPKPKKSTNISKGKPTKQSSTGFGGTSERAVDGNREGNYGGNSVTHTEGNLKAWWEVDLKKLSDISQVKIYNRTDCCEERLSNFNLLFSKRPFPNAPVADAQLQNYGAISISSINKSKAITVSKNARYLRIQLKGHNYLSLAEVEVIGQ